MPRPALVRRSRGTPTALLGLGMLAFAATPTVAAIPAPSPNERVVRISVSPKPFTARDTSMVVRFTTVGPAAHGRYYGVSWSSLDKRASELKSCDYVSYASHYLAGGVNKSYEITLHPIKVFGGPSFCVGPSDVRISTLAYADKTSNKISNHLAGRFLFTVLKR